MYPSSSKIVDTIHTLRGEYFRHTQNQQRKQPDLRTRAASLARNTPTLPGDLLADSVYSTDKPSRCTQNTATWRWQALSVVLPDIAPPTDSQVPSLTLLCLRTLVTSSSDDDFSENIVPYIPSHLRKDLLRWTAVHSPLTNSKLHALSEPDGHVGGELILVGPHTRVLEDQFGDPERDGRLSEWESDESLPAPLHTFILVSAHLAFSTLCSLPATITHLALINLPTPVPIHRLPATCPLVERLDLSYNRWLVGEKEAQEKLGKMNWTRFHNLRVLGLRGCHMPDNLMTEVNKGRWDDVEVIRS